MHFKDIDFKILFELMKNSKVSDRQLAKKLGVSQPTVTRRRARLERDLIDGYTAIPKWAELGYRIMAITLVKIKPAIATKKKYASVREKAIKWLSGQPNIIMSGGCRGAGVDSFMISLHQTYGDYDSFMSDHRLELGDFVEDIQSVIVNLAGSEVVKPLHLKYLTEAKMTSR